MKKLEISKKQEIIGGYDVYLCSLLGAILAMGSNWSDTTYEYMLNMYIGFDCIV